MMQREEGNTEFKVSKEKVPEYKATHTHVLIV
jgi:hypothetical protein